MTTDDMTSTLQLLGDKLHITVFVDVIKRVTAVSDDVRASRADVCESLPLQPTGTVDRKRLQTDSYR